VKKRIAQVVMIVVAATAPAPPLVAQDTNEQIREAVQAFTELNWERSLAFLRKVVSPSSPFVVTPEQRVEAYKYLGASLAIAGQRDSALVYFQAALQRDPFVDLDQGVFTSREKLVFAEARKRLFGLGVRGIAPTVIEGSTGRVVFVFATTHPATVRADIRRDGQTALTLFQGESDGFREIPWGGRAIGGQFVPAGRYELVVAGNSRLNQRSDSSRVFFDVRYDHPPLEDTLPSLRPEDLLPERHAPSAARGDLLKGFTVAAAALVIGTILPSRELEGDKRTLSAGVAVGGIAGGVAAMWYGRNHREIPANIAENRARRTKRDSQNAGIVARNNEKLAVAKLVITPAGALSQ
jgi:hypothetical protein